MALSAQGLCGWDNRACHFRAAVLLDSSRGLRLRYTARFGKCSGSNGTGLLLKFFRLAPLVFTMVLARRRPRRTYSRSASSVAAWLRIGRAPHVRTTVMERCKVPLHKWLYSMYLLVTARKGISSLQLAKEIGVTQKTAWFILGRLREACGGDGPGGGLEKLRGTVEVDECFIGGMRRTARAQETQGRSRIGR